MLTKVTICKRYKGEPEGYVAWNYWAQEKNKKYRQVECKQCGLWHKWIKR